MGALVNTDAYGSVATRSKGRARRGRRVLPELPQRSAAQTRSRDMGSLPFTAPTNGFTGLQRGSSALLHVNVDRRRRGRPTLSPEMLVGIVRAADILVVVGASIAAFALHLGVTRHPKTEVERYFLTSLLSAALFVAGFQYVGGYTITRLSQLRWQLTRCAATWAVTAAALLVIAFVSKISGTYSRGWALGWILTSEAFFIIDRGFVCLAIAQWMRCGRLVKHVVIFGVGEQGERLISKLHKMQNKSIAICGVFDDRGSRVPQSVCGYEVLGNTDDLISFAREFPIEEVMIALPLSAEARLKQIVDKLKALPADLRISAEPMAEKLPLRGLSYLGEIPFLAVAERPLKHWSAVTKWVEDKVLSAILLVLLTPLMAIIVLLIKLDSRGSVLFVQERFGFNNNVIRVLKFRTMYVDHGDLSGAQRTVKNDPRVTRVGRVLRSLSLDELPQLLNVLHGEMSLIGPRAHAVAMRAGDQLYPDAIAEYAQRHRVKPGITGWAQVNGYRGEVDTIEKACRRVEYDLYYIEHWSVWLDLKIAALTLRTVLSPSNTY
jgi:Undecaprenyl-phosphate glucose phosphotransferase